MSMHSRLSKLEAKAGLKKGLVVIRCIHPDSWEGPLPPGCYRKSEAKNAKVPPNTKLVYNLNLGFCMRTRESYFLDKPCAGETQRAG